MQTVGSRNKNSPPNELDASCSESNPPLPRLVIARWLYWSRGKRPIMGGNGIFSDPAWDILLDLYIRQCEGKHTSVTSSCIASRVPPTTALRYHSLMEKNGWIVRIKDESDKRIRFVRLTGDGERRLTSYFDEVGSNLVNVLSRSLSGLDYDHANRLITDMNELTGAIQSLNRKVEDQVTYAEPVNPEPDKPIS